MDEPESGQGRIIERVAAILSALADEAGDVGPTALAKSLDLPPTTVHRMLQYLARTGLAAHSPKHGTYSLGHRLLTLGLIAQERVPLKAEARATLELLRDETGESAAAYLRVERGHYIALDQALTHQEPKRFFLGGLFPLHIGASGRAMLAFESPQFIDEYLAATPLNRVEHAPQGPGLVDPRDLAADLAQTRDRGFSMSFSETVARTNSLAFPLMNSFGTPLGALAILGPAERWTERVMVEKAATCQPIVDNLRMRIRYMEPHYEAR